jgi:hypothetical protein
METGDISKIVSDGGEQHAPCYIDHDAASDVPRIIWPNR